MKRFFAPAPAPGDANKRLKPGEDPSAPRRSDPASFVTWNANSLLGRLRKDLDKSSFFAYVEEKDPDVICLQETWLPAAGPDRRGVLRDDTKTYREDKQLIDLVMRQKPLSKYRAYWSCADIKRAGSGVLVKKDIDVVSVRRGLTRPGESHEEGRVLLLEFANSVLLNTYAQNNGWTAESMAKRRRWDAELRSFLTGESEVRRATHPDGRVKPLVWTGDLNACHREVDVTHPSFFLNQKPEGKKGGAPPPQPEDPDDRGQPGFTVNERRRFDDIVVAAKLVDAYRLLHGDAARRMTWFGHPGVVQVGKYRGKGMRLDYFFVDDALARRVVACVQATDGIPDGEMLERPDRAFFGSDHCAVYMRLREEQAREEEKEKVANEGGDPRGEVEQTEGRSD